MQVLADLWNWFFGDDIATRDEFMAYFGGPDDPYAYVDGDFFLEKLFEFVSKRPGVS